MNIFDFIALTNDQQLDTVSTMGVFVSSRNDAGHRITLYQVNDFHVEVHFSMREMRITMLSAIRNEDLPAPNDAEERQKGTASEPVKNHKLPFIELDLPAYYRSSLS